jgi:hypothetical protein
MALVNARRVAAFRAAVRREGVEMRIRAIAQLAAAVLLGTPLAASGPVGIYGIVEKVVFEPDEAGAERVQVWGAFAYAEPGDVYGVSDVVRGYLYFTVPPTGDVANVRREWADLASIAGTGQVVAFGQWGYIGRFQDIDPRARNDGLPYVYARVPQGGEFTDLRVRPGEETPAAPAVYQTNAGIAKLSGQGSHADLVRRLREALR